MDNGTPVPGRFGGADASLLLITAPWGRFDITEAQRPEGVFARELGLSHLGGVLCSVAALAGLGLVLAGTLM